MVVAGIGVAEAAETALDPCAATVELVGATAGAEVTVVPTTYEVVLTTVELAGQFVTVSAQLVMVISAVLYRVTVLEI
jgi:hypothetical protein